MAKKNFVNDLKNNVKQGIGDAIDTVTRLPNRIVGKLGLKQAYTKTNPKNKGEVAAADLKDRIKSGYEAFMTKKPSKEKNIESKKARLKK